MSRTSWVASFSVSETGMTNQSVFVRRSRQSFKHALRAVQRLMRNEQWLMRYGVRVTGKRSLRAALKRHRPTEGVSDLLSEDVY